MDHNEIFEAEFQPLIKQLLDKAEEHGLPLSIFTTTACENEGDASGVHQRGAIWVAGRNTFGHTVEFNALSSMSQMLSAEDINVEPTSKAFAELAAACFEDAQHKLHMKFSH